MVDRTEPPGLWGSGVWTALLPSSRGLFSEWTQQHYLPFSASTINLTKCQMLHQRQNSDFSANEPLPSKGGEELGLQPRCEQGSQWLQVTRTGGVSVPGIMNASPLSIMLQDSPRPLPFPFPFSEAATPKSPAPLGAEQGEMDCNRSRRNSNSL